MSSATNSSTENDQPQVESSTETPVTVTPSETMPNLPQPAPLNPFNPFNPFNMLQPAIPPQIPLLTPEALAGFWQMIYQNAAAVAIAQHGPVAPILQAEPEKKNRSFTDAQKAILNARFEKSNFIHLEERIELSKSIGLDERQIRMWFQNKRAKVKRSTQPKL